MNLSAPRPEGRGLLKVHPEPRFATPPSKAGLRAVEWVKLGQDVFVDTSAFIALRVRDDVNYEKAQQFLDVIKEKRLKLHTTNFILDEVYTYFCRSHAVAIEMAKLITDNPLILFHRVAAEDENSAMEILKAFEDKEFSFTDATSFAIMERLEITTAFAFDDHFRQYGKLMVVP